jgi:hypothetical protein
MTSLDSASLKFWESVAEWGFRMVFIGVAGEGAEIIAKLFFIKSFKKHEHLWDVFSAICWLILVVGLAIEFKGTHNVTGLADSENARLTDEAAIARREAGQANERAAIIESNSIALSLTVEGLRSNNLVVEKQVEELHKENLLLETRTITQNQMEAFTNILRNTLKCPVRVFVQSGNEDFETENYARQIRELLDDAGYGRGNNEGIEKVRLGVVADIGAPSEYCHLLFLFYGKPHETIDWPSLKIQFQGGKYIMATTISATSTNDLSSVPGMINLAFKQIGINPGVQSGEYKNCLKPGEWAIFIPPKF